MHTEEKKQGMDGICTTCRQKNDDIFSYIKELLMHFKVVTMPYFKNILQF